VGFGGQPHRRPECKELGLSWLLQAIAETSLFPLAKMSLIRLRQRVKVRGLLKACNEDSRRFKSRFQSHHDGLEAPQEPA
jgi:hypothetical protein